jgi:predicted tellurium resistance membrane protein TerC
METIEIGKYTKSFELSFAITSLISALLVILKESNEETVLEWMKAASGHHWITHGIIDIILFVGLGLVLSGLNSGQGPKISANTLIGTIVTSTLISGLLIAGFYMKPGVNLKLSHKKGVSGPYIKK